MSFQSNLGLPEASTISMLLLTIIAGADVPIGDASLSVITPRLSLPWSDALIAFLSLLAPLAASAQDLVASTPSERVLVTGQSPDPLAPDNR